MMMGLLHCTFALLGHDLTVKAQVWPWTFQTSHQLIGEPLDMKQQQAIRFLSLAHTSRTLLCLHEHDYPYRWMKWASLSLRWLDEPERWLDTLSTTVVGFLRCSWTMTHRSLSIDLNISCAERFFPSNLILILFTRASGSMEHWIYRALNRSCYES